MSPHAEQVANPDDVGIVTTGRDDDRNALLFKLAQDFDGEWIDLMMRIEQGSIEVSRDQSVHGGIRK